MILERKSTALCGDIYTLQEHDRVDGSSSFSVLKNGGSTSATKKDLYDAIERSSKISINEKQIFLMWHGNLCTGKIQSILFSDRTAKVKFTHVAEDTSIFGLNEIFDTEKDAIASLDIEKTQTVEDDEPNVDVGTSVYFMHEDDIHESTIYRVIKEQSLDDKFYVMVGSGEMQQEIELLQKHIYLELHELTNYLRENTVVHSSSELPF